MRLFLCIQDLVADLETIKSRGTNATNSEYLLGLNCTIKSPGVDLRGIAANYEVLGLNCKQEKLQGPRSQIDRTSPLLFLFSVTMAATARSDDSGASGHAFTARAEVTTEDLS